MPNRFTLTTVLAFGLSILAEPAPAWDRNVEARKAMRSADKLYNAHAYRDAFAKYRQAAERLGADNSKSAAKAWSQAAECAEKIGRYRVALDARARALGLHLAADDRVGIAE